VRSEDTISFLGEDGGTTVPAEAGPATDTMPAPVTTGTVFANRFEVVTELGAGGMGQVFRVHDRQIEGREIALKILHPQFSEDERFRRLFFQEVRAGQSFVSEHVVQVRDTGQMDDGRLFLTMDLVQGESLGVLLGREHSLDARHALEIARQMLLGLQSGHEKGFIHRDIKPSNVMLRARVPKTERNPFGVHVLVLDFGLANLAREVGRGQVAGTPFYMSPEQIQGERLDARSDLFAVGVVLYEMVSGSRPFLGKTLHEVTSSVIETDVAPMIAGLEHLSPAIQKLLAKALEKDREGRFQSAGDFIQAIERSKAYRLPARVGPLFAAVALAGTALAGVEGFLLWRQDGEVSFLNGEIARQNLKIDGLEKEQRGLEGLKRQEALQHEQALGEMDQALREKESQHESSKLDFERIKAEMDAQLAQLGERLAKANAELEAERAKTGTGAVQNKDITDQMTRVAADREEFQRRITDLERALREQNGNLDQLRAENEKLRFQLQPEALRARGFDAFLRLVGEGLGVPAWQKYEELSKEVLARGDAHGGDFVEPLARAARELALFEDPGAGAIRGDTQHLRAAGLALQEAQRFLPVLGEVASQWIRQPTLEGAVPDRLGAARTALAFLQEKLEGARLGIADEHAAAAEELLSRPPLEGPTAALEHASRFGCEHLEQALARAAAAAESAVIVDRCLDRKKLLAISALDQWGEALAAADGESGLRADSADGRTLLALWIAWGWYGAGEVRGTRALRERVLGALAAPEESAPWRAILALQMALDPAQYKSHPPPTHGTAGFQLYSRVEAGRPGWIKERCEAGTNSDWLIEKEVISADPLRPTQRTPSRIRQAGEVFAYDGWSLDLRMTGAQVGVESWSPPEHTLPQGLALPIVAKDLAEFRSDLGDEPLACLVIEQEGIRRWISPRLGLVREEKKDTFVKELIYTSAKRN